MKPWCSACDIRPVRAGGLCATCYQFRRRNGRDRPEELRIAENVERVTRDFERKALPTHRLYARQRAQRPRLADRVEEAVRERQERLRREAADSG